MRRQLRDPKIVHDKPNRHSLSMLPHLDQNIYGKEFIETYSKIKNNISTGKIMFEWRGLSERIATDHDIFPPCLALGLN